MKRNMVSRYVAAVLVVMGLSLAAGCATTDTVSSRFPLLEENINSARAVEARVYAPNPLKSAEARLEAAKTAVAAKDMIGASRLVDEAMVDADYARALAPTEKAKVEAGKLREEILAVRGEISKMPAAL